MAVELPFGGPFNGLNTTHSPRELPPRYAAQARNVLYAEGQVRPRAPFVDYLTDLAAVGRFENLLPANPSREIISLFHFSPDIPGIQRVLAIKTRDATDREGPTGEIWVIITPSGEGPQFYTARMQQLASGLNTFPMCFATMNDMVYAADGGEYVYRLCGNRQLKLERAGLPNPRMPWVEMNGLPKVADETRPAGLPAREYQFKITWYNEDLDIESNGSEGQVQDATIYDGDPDTGAAGFRIYRSSRSYTDPYEPPELRGITHWRIYVRDNTRKDIGYYMVVQLSLDETEFYYTGETIPQGSVEDGPWAPSKNYPPDGMRFSILFPFRGRMFFGRHVGPDAEQLFYSEAGHPDHVDPDDYVLVPNDGKGGGIHGLAEIAGQLAICRKRAVHLLAGDIVGTTNETIATGAAPPASAHELYRTSAVAGCVNSAGGNGAIVIGKPPTLHYNGEAGFYRFDGVTELMVSENIKPTWRKFAQGIQKDEDRQAVSYAVDTANAVVYIANAEAPIDSKYGDWPNPIEELENLVLAYHYGRVDDTGQGAWSIIDGDIEGTDEGILAVCTCLGTPTKDLLPGGVGRLVNWPERYVQLLAATARGRILESDDRGTSGVPMPHFLHQTGRFKLVEGRTMHVYHFKWLHDNPNVATLFRVGFGVNGEAPTLQTIDLGASIYSRTPASRLVTDLQLTVQTAETPSDWSAAAAMVGWVIVGDRAGERR